MVKSSKSALLAGFAVFAALGASNAYAAVTATTCNTNPALECASTSSGKTYAYNPLPVTPNTISTAGTLDINDTKSAATFTDDFTFTISGNYQTTLSAVFNYKTPASYDLISSADLSLFRGVPGVGTQTQLATTGTQDFSSTSPTTFTLFVSEPLTPGVDYYLQSTITVPNGGTALNGRSPYDRGAYGVTANAAEIVSAAPEPGVWALMMIGVGMMGAALRFGRRGSTMNLAA